MAFGGRRCLPNASRFHSIAVESRPSLKFMGQEPFAKVDVLRQSGLLKLLIPVEDGGLGGRWTDALKVTRAIASGDCSIRQLIGYHYVGGSSPDVRFSVRRNQHRDPQ
jgi:alkylation response protein AidB-like acyl-CoA dehydrogenase